MRKFRYLRANEIDVRDRCGSDIFNGDEYVESYDGIFCDMECCHKYYGIGIKE